MASVRERKWARGRTAFVVDYVDVDGRRRLQTFKSERAANMFKSAIEQALLIDREEQDAAQRRIAEPMKAAPAPADLSEDLLWGANKIAAFLNIGQRQAFYLLEQGNLPAKKVGNRWVCSRTKLQAALAG